jgi:hypothetical protein
MLRKSSVEVLRSRYPDEAALAGGGARIPSVDRELRDELVASIGAKEARKLGVNALSADWIASEHFLHYVSPKIQSVRSFAWEQIRGVRIVRTRKLSQVSTVELLLDPSTVLEMEIGRASSSELLAMAQRFGPGQPAGE